MSYPQHLRDEILDYLFKPNFGASLHILKVEIGGDAQSTDGTESSHMHESWDENYQRGYEWWLMTEAKKRNPNIKFYGLPWAFPGWLGGKTHNPYDDPTQLAEYVIKWIKGAKIHYGLTIDYIGQWNEQHYNITYIKCMRKVLDDHGLQHVKLVIQDKNPRVGDMSPEVLANKGLAAVTDIIGAHYPGTVSTAAALKTNKTLWASEDFSTYNDEVGGGCWARLLNQNYVNGYMTGTISWNLIAAYYMQLPWGRSGLMTAMEPWSGHYVVEAPIWMTAHTTQFTKPGWRYLQHKAGVGHLDKGGSYVTLVSPDGKDFTMVIETMSHDHSICVRPSLPAYTVEKQTATFMLKGSLRHVTELHMWVSHLQFDGSEHVLFQPQTPVAIHNGTFTIDFDLDMVVTVTTIGLGQHGQHPDPPASANFPLPYKDDFESYPEFSEAGNFVPQTGVWEVRKSGDHKHGMVNRQVVLNQPCDWHKPMWVPINIGGNHAWANVKVSADVSIPSTNGTSGLLMATRVVHGGNSVYGLEGVYFAVYTNGSYALFLEREGAAPIQKGTVATSIKLNTWYNMALATTGPRAYGFWDGKPVFVLDMTDEKPAGNGWAGYGTTGWGLADFDNFVVEKADWPVLF